MKKNNLRELALAYFPGDKPKTAQQKLAKWMKVETLRRKLELLGWKPYQKVLTPKQFDCIINHVGEPDGWDIYNSNNDYDYETYYER
ncbi:DUF4248 domain-containing protein [Parabacteroides gordonii]|uniref:DUF4248 domain-containing protein n=1 Tax=Parabacteroides gordonii MS-1 = DSM 23371 TaxID=1203610 RepID=A0A0F5JP90_9BACT|nr:DUF4248 domain-containing protein [Parabacteroides gordonii]KKB59631.1 hypothetical protein HMPREF1536_00612 [Parabacteroides gordonii MS-1 = DSM 23371]MCA5583966.1 DUF4248 domain-containing protein [Parabacteroides gordonii]